MADAREAWPDGGTPWRRWGCPQGGALAHHPELVAGVTPATQNGPFWVSEGGGVVVHLGVFQAQMSGQAPGTCLMWRRRTIVCTVTPTEKKM